MKTNFDDLIYLAKMQKIFGTFTGDFVNVDPYLCVSFPMKNRREETLNLINDG